MCFHVFERVVVAACESRGRKSPLYPAHRSTPSPVPQPVPGPPVAPGNGGGLVSAPQTSTCNLTPAAASVQISPLGNDPQLSFFTSGGVFTVLVSSS